jgi:hypothetical protein
MDWAGWAVFGLVATTALTAVMIAAQLAGLTRLDLPLVLGTLVTADPDRARVAGFFIHLIAGQGFALGYAATFALVHRATWWLGALPRHPYLLPLARSPSRTSADAPCGRPVDDPVTASAAYPSLPRPNLALAP